MWALLIELKCVPEIECLRKREEEGVVERRGGRYGKAEQRVTLVVVSSRGTNTVLVLAATAIVSVSHTFMLSFPFFFCWEFVFRKIRKIEREFACYLSVMCFGTLVFNGWHVDKTHIFIGSLSIFKIHIILQFSFFKYPQISSNDTFISRWWGVSSLS
jgi:hypothetical protein